MAVAFVKATTPPFDVYFNRLAAAVTGGAFCHVEICFKNLYLLGIRRLLSYYVGERMSDEKKRARDALRYICSLFPRNCPPNTCITVAFFALQGMPLGVRVLAELADDPFYMMYGEGWTEYEIKKAPDDVVTSQFIWCLQQTGKPYDTMGALSSPLRSAYQHNGMEADRATWFCSNYALRFCQHMAICGDLGLSGTTPNALEKELRETYIDSATASVSELGSSVYSLNLGQEHWSIIGDFVPYVIRSGNFTWDRATFLENVEKEAEDDV